jgi:hypothetical protein
MPIASPHPFVIDVFGGEAAAAAAAIQPIVMYGDRLLPRMRLLFRSRHCEAAAAAAAI